MVICAIFGCSKRSGRDNVSFFRIPCVDMKRNYKNSELLLKRQKLWITRIKRDDLDQMKIRNARICSLHFISGKPSSLEDIDDPDWAPSINLGHKKVEDVTATVKRYQRRLDRQKTQSCNTASTSMQNHDDDINTDSGSELEVDSADTGPVPSTSQEKVDAACGTDLTSAKINQLEETSKDYFSLKSEYYALKEKVQTDFANINIQSFKDDAQINFYTGLVNYKTLEKLFNFVSPHVPHTINNKLTNFQQLILFLVRLRLNLETQDLGYRFNISQETASRTFNKWLEIMFIRIRKLVFWPERQTLITTLPSCFRSTFEGHVAVIIDCFEISICRPSSLRARAATWSNYKQRNTIKYLIGITPQGFISVGFAGRCSDKYVTENSGILNNLIPGDVVLADRGFMNLNSVGFFCAKLVLPASARGVKQLNSLDVQSTRQIASLRIHVERVIGQLRQKFQILKGVLPLELLNCSDGEFAQIDKIVHVCCSLVNLMPSVVR